MERQSAVDLASLQTGALVLGEDYEVGTLESVRPSAADEEPKLIIRHGHADYLLAIPIDAIERACPTRIYLNLRRQDAELLLYEANADAGPTLPTPPVDALVGKQMIEPMDGPGTG